MSMSIFEEIGGEAAIDKAVDLFYQKVLADDRIKHFFDGVDMQKQSNMQRAFLTFAFGGPNSYEGRSLKAAHERLVKEMGLNDSHFDAVLEDLGNTLKELGVPDNLIAKAAGVAESVRDDVLGKKE